MKRINALIVYLIIVTFVAFLAQGLVTILPFAAGVYKDNVGATLLFIAICALLFAAAVLMTVYYMLKLVTGMEIKDDKLVVAVFLKVHSFSFDEIDDIKNMTGGKYKIITNKKTAYTLFIRLLDKASLKTLFDALGKI